jgi:hypothetical protein
MLYCNIFFSTLRPSYIALREILLKGFTLRTEDEKRKGRKVKSNWPRDVSDRLSNATLIVKMMINALRGSLCPLCLRG